MKFCKINTLKFSILIVIFLCAITIQAEVKNNSIKSFNFVQSQLDLRKNGDILFFSLRTYSQSQLKKIIVTFNSPSGREMSETSCDINKTTNGELIIGNLKLKKKSESGVWCLGKIVLETIAGELIIFPEEYFIQQKNNTKVLIKGKDLR